MHSISCDTEHVKHVARPDIWKCALSYSMQLCDFVRLLKLVFLPSLLLPSLPSSLPRLPSSLLRLPSSLPPFLPSSLPPSLSFLFIPFFSFLFQGERATGYGVALLMTLFGSVTESSLFQMIAPALPPKDVL